MAQPARSGERGASMLIMRHGNRSPSWCRSRSARDDFEQLNAPRLLLHAWPPSIPLEELLAARARA